MKRLYDEVCLCRVFAPYGPDSAYIGQLGHCPIHAPKPRFKFITITKEKIKKALAWIGVLTMYSVIGYWLGQGYLPENIMPEPPETIYTNAAFEEIERENAHIKNMWRKADSVIMDILKATK